MNKKDSYLIKSIKKALKDSNLSKEQKCRFMEGLLSAMFYYDHLTQDEFDCISEKIEMEFEEN